MSAPQQPPSTDAGLLWALLEHASVDISLFDPRVRSWRVNPTQCERVSRSGTELLGRASQGCVPRLADQLGPLRRAVLTTGRPERAVAVHERSRAHAGADRTYSVSCFRVQTPNGPLAGVAASILDATARTRAQQAADLANERLALLNQASIVPVCAWDAPEVLRQEALPDQRLAEPSPPPGSADFTRRLRLRTRLCGQRIAREIVLGAASPVTSWSGRSSAEADPAFAEALAARAARAVDHVRLLARDRGIARTLPRSLVAPGRHRIDGWERASPPAPGAVGTEVGDDCCDVHPRPCARAGPVIGDVLGPGLGTAAVMGHRRAILRALARPALSPEKLPGHLHDRLAALAGAQIAAGTDAVADPSSRRLALSNAGHPPPLQLPTNGPASPCAVETGIPLEARGFAHELVEVALASGTGLPCGTDRLVQHRGGSSIEGIHRLAAQSPGQVGPVVGPPGALGAGRESAVRTLLAAADRDDDDALLAGRLPAAGSAVQVASLDLPLAAPATGTARRCTAEHLQRWGTPPATVAVTRLLVSEQVTHAVRRAGGPHPAAPPARQRTDLRGDRRWRRLVAAPLPAGPRRQGRPRACAGRGPRQPVGDPTEPRRCGRLARAGDRAERGAGRPVTVGDLPRSRRR